MMEVSLRIRGVDVDDEDVEQIIGEHFSDALWSSTDKIDLVTVFVDDENAVSQTVRWVEALETKIPDLKVAGVYRDHVGTTDIAQRSGVSREAARKWTLDGTFPTPADYISGANMKIWTWAEVAEWLKNERGFEFEPRPASTAVLDQIEHHILRSLTRRASFLNDRK